MVPAAGGSLALASARPSSAPQRCLLAPLPGVPRAVGRRFPRVRTDANKLSRRLPVGAHAAVRGRAVVEHARARVVQGVGAALPGGPRVVGAGGFGVGPEDVLEHGAGVGRQEPAEREPVPDRVTVTSRLPSPGHTRRRRRRGRGRRAPSRRPPQLGRVARPGDVEQHVLEPRDGLDPSRWTPAAIASTCAIRTCPANSAGARPAACRGRGRRGCGGWPWAGEPQLPPRPGRHRRRPGVLVAPGGLEHPRPPRRRPARASVLPCLRQPPAELRDRQRGLVGGQHGVDAGAEHVEGVGRAGVGGIGGFEHVFEHSARFRHFRPVKALSTGRIGNFPKSFFRPAGHPAAHAPPADKRHPAPRTTRSSARVRPPGPGGSRGRVSTPGRPGRASAG